MSDTGSQSGTPVGPGASGEPPLSGRSSPSDDVSPVKQRARIPAWLEFPLLIVGAFLVAFVVKTFLVQAFYIPSGSMEDTLQVGDRVLVNKVVYHLRPVERGDVIVFDGTGSFISGDIVEPERTPVESLGRLVGEIVGLAPPRDTDFIKRVIGVGGDRVVCCDVDGRITVNGVPLDERPYLYRNNPPSKQSFDVLVPEGTLWVMGDHRSASADSRAHMGDPGGGFVPVDKVIGRAFAVVWPFGNAQILEIPATFEQPALEEAPSAS
ncbi:MAG: signal peptidase I [Candidatus Nanopelagicales bacterium]|jgi:signal peptidase I